MPTVDNDEFFEQQEVHSEIKTQIVAGYFERWSNIMLAVQDKYPQHPKRLHYIDHSRVLGSSAMERIRRRSSS